MFTQQKINYISMDVEIKDGKLMFKSTLESQDRIEMTIACWAERERKCGIGLKIQGRNAASALLRINSVLKMQHISWHELCHSGFENYGWVCIQLTKLKILCWNATLGWAGSGWLDLCPAVLLLRWQTLLPAACNAWIMLHCTGLL